MSALSIKGDRLLDTHGKEIATLADTLGPEIKSSYINLFATAPQLLAFLAEEVSSAVEYIEERSKIRGRVRDGYLYFPKWLDQAAKIVAFAQGVEGNLTGTKLNVVHPEEGGVELRDKQDNIVLRFTARLNQAEIDRYAKLFIAAPALLEIVEAMSNEGLAAMRKEYETGSQFDPAGADTYRFIIPDRLKYISDMVSKARGAVPLPDAGFAPSRQIGQKLWTDAPADRQSHTGGGRKLKDPAQMYRAHRNVSFMFLIFGTVILGTMGEMFYTHSNLEKYGRYASGKVLECIDQAEHVPPITYDSKRHLFEPLTYETKCYKYKIEFQPVSGNKVDIVGGPNTKREEVNGAVTILYMADDPQHTAIIDDPPSEIFWGIGIICCLASFYFLWAARKAKFLTPM